MLVTIDVDQLVRDAATRIMDEPYAVEWRSMVEALQKQLPENFTFHLHVRQQVKEYKKLTMWRD